MFIGFIKETGIVEQVNVIEPGVEIIIQTSSLFAAELQVNSFIAIDGKVLILVHKEEKADFNLVKFNAPHVNQIENIQPKKRVNLERAIRLGEEIPGTFFYGIPSGQAKVVSLENLSGGRLNFKVYFADDLVNYLSINDQVSLNGISLQISDINTDIISFQLCTNTLNFTNLGEANVGDLLNIEIDPFTAKIAKFFQKKQDYKG